MSWECGECGARLCRSARPTRCSECGVAGAFVEVSPVDDAERGRVAWLRAGFDRGAFREATGDDGRYDGAA